MTDQEFELCLTNVLDEIKDTLIRKRKSYGPGNIATFGELGILVRASDKLARLTNLLKKSEVVEGIVEDTWLDLAGYAVIAMMFRKGWWS